MAKQGGPGRPEPAMTGKTVVMTGATSGLGAVAAEELAVRGARLVLIARDPRRAEVALARLRSRNPRARHGAHIADLSVMAEVKRVAAEVAVAAPRIDVLANNAGALFGPREVTAEGLERTFATNHMAYVVLTLGLRDALVAAGGTARVVNTASAAHRASRYDPGDAEFRRGYNGMRAYGRSKLCNILFTRELARRWAGLGITANCFHPGFVATSFGDRSGALLSPLVRAAKLFAISPEKGARTLIYLASAPEVAGITGGYFDRCRVIAPTAAGQDDRAAAALWRQSLSLAGIEA